MKTLILQEITVEELRNLISDVVKAELSKGVLQTNDSFEYLSREEVSKLLNISLVTLNNWTKVGKIKAHRMGARIFYTKADIANAMRPVKGSQERRWK